MQKKSINKIIGSGNLGWLDMEMTGLEPSDDEILELVIVITDNSLNILAESVSWVFACDSEVLDSMDNWNTSMHNSSGLVDLVKNSTLDYTSVEAQALAFMRKWIPEGQTPMCGSTICQDRRFLARHMRKLHDYFHYRNLDVSSFKLACGYWMQNMPTIGNKNSNHRALADIKGSINEMRHYHDILFKR